MISSAGILNGDLPNDLIAKAQKVIASLERAVKQEAEKRGLVPAMVPALLPCIVLGVVDPKLLHVTFTPISAGGLPTQIWQDWRARGPISQEQVHQSAISNFGFRDPETVSLEATVLNAQDSVRDAVTAHFAKQYVEEKVKIAARPRAIPGYEGLQPSLDAFSQEHPNFERNVFLAMRFRSGKQFLEVHAAIKSGLAKYALNGLRADDKMYLADGDLWSNICVYMMGCKFGVCVFEEIDEREFNPNVPLEYGFLRAMNRQVLLLKDQRMPKLPSDMTGKLYRHFDTYEITSTIDEQISQWAERDLGLKPASK